MTDQRRYTIAAAAINRTLMPFGTGTEQDVIDVLDAFIGGPDAEDVRVALGELDVGIEYPIAFKGQAGLIVRREADGTPVTFTDQEE